MAGAAAWLFFTLCWPFRTLTQRWVRNSGNEEDIQPCSSQRLLEQNACFVFSSFFVVGLPFMNFLQSLTRLQIQTLRLAGPKPLSSCLSNWRRGGRGVIGL